MTRRCGRLSFWVSRRPSTRYPGQRWLSRGAYGSWSATLLWRPWTVQVVRSYPDDRLRCPRCGYRRNDT